MLSRSTLCALLVEDDLIYQNIIRHVLVQTDSIWKIHTASSGTSALNALADEDCSFNLAVIDIGLPDISGIEVLAAARKRYPDLPIMVLTANDDETAFLSAIRAGTNGYLVKGTTEISLPESISRVMSGQYPVSPSMARHLFRLAGSPIAIPKKNRLNLSRRELQLLRLLAQGKSYVTCANSMNISLSTVQTHIRNMYRKLDVSNQRQAINMAQNSGLLHF